jgi:hypothetical protein
MYLKEIITMHHRLYEKPRREGGREREGERRERERERERGGALDDRTKQDQGAHEAARCDAGGGDGDRMPK